MTDLSPVPVEPLDGQVVTPQHQLARRLTDEWLGDLTSATHEAYRRDLTLWHEWCAANGVDPLAARKTNVNQWIKDQQAEGLAKRTIARRVSAVASWYTYLHDETKEADAPLAVVNPAKTKKRPNVARDSSPTLSITSAEARALVAAADADGPRSAALIRVLLDNGFRVGSIVGARIENLAEDDGHHVIMLAGKGDSRHKAALPPPAYRAIRAMLASRGDPAEGPLFATSTGRPVDRFYVFRLVRRLAGKAGISSAAHLSPHSMRKTFATQANRRGVPLRRIQQDMWHADARTTEGYIAASKGLDDSAAYKVSGDFEPVAEGEPDNSAKETGA